MGGVIPTDYWPSQIGLLRAVISRLPSSYSLNFEVGVLLPVNAGESEILISGGDSSLIISLHQFGFGSKIVASFY